MDNAFSHIAAAQGWKQVGNIAVGSYEGFPFAAKPETNDAIKAIISFQLEVSVPGKLIKEATKQMPKGYTPQAATNRIDIKCRRDKDDADGNDMRKAIGVLVDTLRTGGITPPVTCPFCKSTGCDSLAFTGGVYTVVHRDCVARATLETAEKAAQNEDSGNYITGFIGAFIGGLVGIISSVLSIMLAERIFSLLYALIPICAYQGYKLFKGKLNKTALVFTIIVSVLHLFTLEQVLLYIEIVREFGHWPNIIDTISLYWSYMSFSDAISDMGSSFIFLALGIWIAWGQISRTNKDIVNDLLLTKDSLADLDAQEEHLAQQ